MPQVMDAKHLKAFNKAVPARRATRKATTQRDEGTGLTALHDLGAGRRP